MINWIKGIFSKKKIESIKWQVENSIYNKIESNLDENGFPIDKDLELPDEERKENEIKFAHGFTDAIFSSDQSVDEGRKIKELSNLFEIISSSGDEHSKFQFYKKISENENTVNIIDGFLEEIVSRRLSVRPYLYDYASDLILKTENRNAVKFGIAIIGLCQDKESIRYVKKLGVHDEFTIYAAVAIINLSEKPQDDLWHLAKRTDGWGKIQVVEKLCQLEDLSDAIKYWLLVEGYKNNIMYEYLALSCAKAGDLKDKVSNDVISSELYNATGELLVSMLDESPAEGISSYKDAAFVIKQYIEHSKLQKIRLVDFIRLDTIKKYIIELKENNLDTCNLSLDDIRYLAKTIDEISNSKDWDLDIQKAIK